MQSTLDQTANDFLGVSAVNNGPCAKDYEKRKAELREKHREYVALTKAQNSLLEGREIYSRFAAAISRMPAARQLRLTDHEHITPDHRQTVLSSNDVWKGLYEMFLRTRCWGLRPRPAIPDDDSLAHLSSVPALIDAFRIANMQLNSVKIVLWTMRSPHHLRVPDQNRLEFSSAMQRLQEFRFECTDQSTMEHDPPEDILPLVSTCADTPSLQKLHLHFDLREIRNSSSFARFVKEINAERVIALTATATPRVALDIAEAFGIKESCIFKTSPYRPNLYLDAMTINTPAVDSVKDYMNMISSREDPETQRRFRELVCWLNTHPGPTLIYVAVREQAEAHAKYLVRKGFRAAPFHAKLKTEKKKEVQEGFMSGAIEVVCATIAFGMGIDKPDIRNVVHWDLSNSIEEYSQQIGRAGRDGQPSCCMFYLAPSAFHLRQLFARGDVASRHSIKLLVEDILRRTNGLPVGAIVNVSHFSQGKRFDIQQNTMAVIYATLELTFELLRATTPEYSNYRFTPEPSYTTLFTGHCTPEVKAIKEYAVKDGNDLELDFKRAARLSVASTLKIMKTLDVWQDKGYIDILKYGIEQRYVIVKQLPQTQEEIDEVIDKLYANQLAKEQDSLTRNQQVMDLITGARCFAVALADHFGMGLPDKKDSCGHCIFCVKGRPIQMPRKPDVGPVKAATIRAVLRATPIRDDPRFLTRVGFGMSSPRIIREKLSKKAVFRSLASYDFDDLLREFTRACQVAGFRNAVPMVQGMLPTQEPSLPQPPPPRMTRAPPRGMLLTPEPSFAQP
ncbi:hypothetical protein V8F06_004243 [Rhypophila decipiens]